MPSRLGASAMLSGDQPYLASVTASANTRSPLAICGSHSFFWASLAASTSMRAQSTPEERADRARARSQLLEEDGDVGQGIARAAVLLGIAMPAQPSSASLLQRFAGIPARIAIELHQRVAPAGVPHEIARRFLDELLRRVE